jgi:Tfp pilus assembly protein PilF
MTLKHDTEHELVDKQLYLAKQKIVKHIFDEKKELLFAILATFLITMIISHMTWVKIYDLFYGNFLSSIIWVIAGLTIPFLTGSISINAKYLKTTAITLSISVVLIYFVSILYVRFGINLLIATFIPSFIYLTIVFMLSIVYHFQKKHFGDKLLPKIISTIIVLIVTGGIFYFVLNLILENKPCYIMLLNRGVAYHNDHEYKKALDLYSEVLHRKPNFTLAFYNRAIIFRTVDMHGCAILDFDEAIRFDPENIGAYSLRGLSHYRLERYQEAINDYSEAIRLDPDLSSVYLARGQSYFALEQYQETINDLDIAIDAGQHHCCAFTLRGRSQFALGHYRQAHDDLRRAYDLDPTSDLVADYLKELEQILEYPESNADGLSE